MNRLQIDQNYSGVTAACQMIRKDIFDRVHGFNQEDYKIFFSDIDICLKILEFGKKIVWTPYATLYHHESKTIKSGNNTKQQERSNILK